jgi:iron transport multicopper oxidase
MVQFWCLLLALLAAVAPVLAGIQELWWNLTYVENANPDGLFERRVIGVNGTWPSVWLLVHLYFC